MWRLAHCHLSVRVLSHDHLTGTVAVMPSGIGARDGVLSVRVLSHVHPTGTVAVMTSGIGTWDGVLSVRVLSHVHPTGTVPWVLLEKGKNIGFLAQNRSIRKSSFG
ncbi:hypothetical protein AVEN_37309-1 [Araneus ventricosus]|uniref:Uncharacterized protein n=1 Tax=Araneus ventricosus TaxID=182803 RepID=A0A4Y2V9K9_ARAVE|nr:hypothetical protein AVEN_37309-1 [Araneus ventricosus]